MISKRKSFIVGLKSTKLSNNEIQILKTWYENGTPNN